MYLFLAVLGPRCCTWAFSSCGVWASHCGGVSCYRDASGLGPLSPVSAGRFLITGPPGKFLGYLLKVAFTRLPLEKEMTAHSSTLAWKIPWTEEPGRLQSMGSQRVGHD